MMALAAPAAAAEDDVHAWTKNRTPRTELELVDASKWDLGGAIVPSAHAPFYLTDPFHADRVGGSSSTASGYALEWRLGYSFGRFSFEPIGGIGKVTSSAIPLADGSSQEASLSRSYIGGQFRYTHPFERVSPFIVAGATYDAYSSPLVIRNATQGAKIDGSTTPSVHARAGVFVRIAPIADVATAFFEGGASFLYTFAGDAFEEAQIALAPYLGLSIMGALSPEKRPSSRPLVEPAREANERARDDAPRVERDCERGNVRSCEAAVRFWSSQETLSQTPVVAAVDALTQGTVGITAPSIQQNAAQEKLNAAWTLYERASFAEAKRIGDQPAYETFVARFPHGEHVEDAKQALLDIEFVAVAEAARANKNLHGVVDFLTKHPSSKRAKDYLVDRGITGLTAEELQDLTTLDPKLDPRFPALVAAATDELDGHILEEAAKLPPEKAVDALQAFVQRHPTSSRVPQAKNLEAEAAFMLAQAKTGEEGIAALTSFRERYPNSPRIEEAQRRERNFVHSIAMSATTAAPMWRFLDRYSKDPQAGEVSEALVAVLLSKSSKEAAEDYQKFLDRFPDHPKKNVVEQRMKAIKRDPPRTSGGLK